MLYRELQPEHISRGSEYLVTLLLLGHGYYNFCPSSTHGVTETLIKSHMARQILLYVVVKPVPSWSG
jgi:hypothetical protein